MAAIIAPGEYRFGAQTGRILVRTYRTGVGARTGHDLILEVGSWQASARVGTEAAKSLVTLSVDADSFQVREGRGGLKPLSEADRREICSTIRGKVLDTARYPAMGFRSTAIRGTPDDLSVEGELTIRDVTAPVTVRGSVRGPADRPRLRATAQVVQSRWGIKPYSAFFGALKLRDAVEIDVEVTLTPAAEARLGEAEPS